ncbi:hypothetical protein HNR23_004011 [Nocardiopsis mwathae]|uniref:DUF6504 domain-containing protein n=1 Tax=Nocardiopsis mwathae TaxID=1472723 RepID=A0A7W9YMJ2_9ACTN|nr:hypothetical protein [Nocardiopsis mwathae]
MSLYNERIDVRSSTGGHPALFSWRGRMFRVRRVIGTWNSAPGTPDADIRLVRVAAESDRGEPTIADITLDTATADWTMRRMWN